ncbi:MAG: hypothetical protein AAFN48_02370, partial [Pseudomonadota bacterium]
LSASISTPLMIAISLLRPNAKEGRAGSLIYPDTWPRNYRCLTFRKFTTLAGILFHTLSVIIRIAGPCNRVSQIMGD